MEEDQKTNPPMTENSNQPIVQNPSPVPAKEPENGSVGALIGLVIILGVIILGGLYFLGQRIEMMNTSKENVQDATTTESVDDISLIENQSSSDETSSIEADLNSTNIEGIDSEFN